MINSWLDRDLGIAGRVELHDGSTFDVIVDEAICAFRSWRSTSIRCQRTRSRPRQAAAPHTGVGIGRTARGEFADVAGRSTPGTVAADDVAAWEFCLFDRTAPAILGADQSLLAAGRLDNQLWCWAAVDAICSARDLRSSMAVIALFDHEEVGIESNTGAAGPLLEHVLERLALANGATSPIS